MTESAVAGGVFRQIVEQARDVAIFVLDERGTIVLWNTGAERLFGWTAAEITGRSFDVLFTPGHSPGHVTYAPREANAIFSGDVLFQSSIGRTDLPGGDHAQLLQTIAGLLDRFDDETQVLPGHMGVTTLGAERRTNPFLVDLVH